MIEDLDIIESIPSTYSERFEALVPRIARLKNINMTLTRDETGKPELNFTHRGFPAVVSPETIDEIEKHIDFYIGVYAKWAASDALRGSALAKMKDILTPEEYQQIARDIATQVVS